MVMIFCDKCNSLMYPDGKKLVCRKCGAYKLASKLKGNLSISEKIEHNPDDDVYVERNSEDEILPTANEECPECNNKTAYFWFEQTRSLDEPETRFFRCTECKFTWREYS